MTAALALAGSGLLLLAPQRPGRRRLAGLAGSRLPTTARNLVPPRMRFTFRNRVIAASVLTGVVTAVVAGPIPGGLAAMVLLVAGWGRRQLSDERLAMAEETRLSGLVASIAAEHAAGNSLAATLLLCADGAGRWQPALNRAGRLAALGSDPAQGLGHEPPLIPLAVGIALSDRTGAALAEVLVRVRTDLLTAQRTRRAVAEAVAGPRSSAALLAGLPALGWAMGAALGARPWSTLTQSPAGLAMLVVGVTLDLVGLVWTLRLTR